MKLDRNSNMPLYMQFKEIVIKMIQSGELKPGSIIPTEAELCSRYGISRYPVRQAMGELEAEGYLKRTRGKGTFVNSEVPGLRIGPGGKLLGLVLNRLTTGFDAQILTGFEKQARKKGYLTVACCSDGSSDEEDTCMDRLVQSGVGGIVLFPCDHSRIRGKVEKIRSRGIYLEILDRDPGIRDADYVGSDNAGGGYTAVRHLHTQGFRNVAFISYKSDVSSIRERLDGYRKAVEDFGLNSTATVFLENDVDYLCGFHQRLLTDTLAEQLEELKDRMPLGIFAINDNLALECLRILQAAGVKVGQDAGIVGFDNILEGGLAPIPLTTVAQNGLLLGQIAADTAIGRMEGETKQVHRIVVPTQLVVRQSCGEGLR